jgi:1,4-alpha-glucan branching enzyme
MGCDFSTLVKQDFTEKFSNLQKTLQKIHKKQERISKQLNHYKNENLPQLETNQIRSTLWSQLEDLQNLISDFSRVQEEEKESLSLSISSSFEEAPRPPISVESREKLRISKQDSDILTKSAKGQNVKLYTTESILEDPEIMALISKNRDKLMKKLTK